MWPLIHLNSIVYERVKIYLEVGIKVLKLAFDRIQSIRFGGSRNFLMISTLLYRYYLHMGVDAEIWAVDDGRD